MMKHDRNTPVAILSLAMVTLGVTGILLAASGCASYERTGEAGGTVEIDGQEYAFKVTEWQKEEDTRRGVYLYRDSDRVSYQGTTNSEGNWIWLWVCNEFNPETQDGLCSGANWNKHSRRYEFTAYHRLAPELTYETVLDITNLLDEVVRRYKSGRIGMSPAPSETITSELEWDKVQEGDFLRTSTGQLLLVQLWLPDRDVVWIARFYGDSDYPDTTADRLREIFEIEEIILVSESTRWQQAAHAFLTRSGLPL